MVLWEMLTGEEPFGEENCESAALRILSGNRLPIPENAGILGDIIQLCWSLEPSQRPTFEKICRMLDNYANRHIVH